MHTFVGKPWFAGPASVELGLLDDSFFEGAIALGADAFVTLQKILQPASGIRVDPAFGQKNDFLWWAPGES